MANGDDQTLRGRETGEKRGQKAKLCRLGADYLSSYAGEPKNRSGDQCHNDRAVFNIVTSL
jgi:hypothetical protein